MQVTLDIKDSVLDKVLYLLENLKSDVKIVSSSKTSYDELTKKELEDLRKSSFDYKAGNKDDFVEYRT